MVVATVCSAFKLLDRPVVKLTVESLSARGFGHPLNDREITVPLQFLLVLQASRPGKHVAKLVVRRPDGDVFDTEPAPFAFSDTSGWIGQCAFEIPPLMREGVHWFNVLLDDVVATRVPFNVTANVPLTGVAARPVSVSKPVITIATLCKAATFDATRKSLDIRTVVPQRMTCDNPPDALVDTEMMFAISILAGGSTQEHTCQTVLEMPDRTTKHVGDLVQVRFDPMTTAWWTASKVPLLRAHGLHRFNVLLDGEVARTVLFESVSSKAPVAGRAH